MLPAEVYRKSMAWKKKMDSPILAKIRGKNSFRELLALMGALYKLGTISLT